MKKFLYLLVFLITTSVCSAGQKCNPPVLPENPTADDLMRAWFDIKYTRFADDVYFDYVDIVLLDKSGFKREKSAIRKRIIKHDKKGIAK